jgi:hypothetical protein
MNIYFTEAIFSIEINVFILYVRFGGRVGNEACHW